MTRSFWKDSNAIKTKSKILKDMINYEIKTEKEMDKIQNEIDEINWTEETKTERIRLFKEYGKILDIYRSNRIRIKWYKDEFLSHNITG